ncbi:MAG: dTMP kinase [Candidatus Altiarchaeota archaeon]
MFIVLEGIDGCGKTTQAKLLSEFLKKNNFDVIMTAEPTENEIGKFIREVLSGLHVVDAKTLALLFTADRYEHLKKIIEPALKEGKIVISERYYYSTIAYQEAQGVSRQWLLELNKFVIMPDIAIVIDIDPKISSKRVKTQEIFENEKFLANVRENYMKFDTEVIKIDGEQSKEVVFSEIKDIVLEKLKL